jgi:hypothetical protein
MTFGIVSALLNLVALVLFVVSRRLSVFSLAFDILFPSALLVLLAAFVAGVTGLDRDNRKLLPAVCIVFALAVFCVFVVPERAR